MTLVLFFWIGVFFVFSARLLFFSFLFRSLVFCLPELYIYNTITTISLLFHNLEHPTYGSLELWNANFLCTTKGIFSHQWTSLIWGFLLVRIYLPLSLLLWRSVLCWESMTSSSSPGINLQLQIKNFLDTLEGISYFLSPRLLFWDNVVQLISFLSHMLHPFFNDIQEDWGLENFHDNQEDRRLETNLVRSSLLPIRGVRTLGKE